MVTGLLIVLLEAASAALASAPQVVCTASNPAVLSRNVTLTCVFQAQLEVLQITWQKKRGKDTQNMVTCSEKYGVHITERFKKHISVLDTDSAISSINITKLEKEDEACYNCLFNAYPNGAFTGEVCLHDLNDPYGELGNEVTCNGQGNDLRLDLNPRDIRTRQSAHLIEKKIGATDSFTVKGQYLDTGINPTCEFWLEKETAQENENNPAEDADWLFTQCSVSGTQKFVVTWNKEGQPVSQEDKVNTTGNLTTVTSTLIHTKSSLPAGHRIICTITPSLPPEAYPENAALGEKEPILGNINKDDQGIYVAWQQHPWVRYLLICAGFLVLLLVSILFYCKVWKKTEAKTPKKLGKVENGPVTPMSSVKQLTVLISEWNSPKLLSEHEPGPASPLNEGTPSNNDQKNPRETVESSLKKRDVRNSARSTNAPRKLQYQ